MLELVWLKSVQQQSAPKDYLFLFYFMLELVITKHDSWKRILGMLLGTSLVVQNPKSQDSKISLVTSSGIIILVLGFTGSLAAGWSVRGS